MRKLLLLLAFWLLCAPPCRAQPVLTTIQDTRYNVDGSLMDGNIIVTNAAFSIGSVPIARGARAFPITNGVVNIRRGEQSVRRRQSSDSAIKYRWTPERDCHNLDRSVLQRARDL